MIIALNSGCDRNLDTPPPALSRPPLGPMSIGEPTLDRMPKMPALLALSVASRPAV
jgi:hypothetical protein